MSSPNSIKKQISEYLNLTLRSDEIVVGALRYGAHLLHLYESSRAGSVKIPTILSHMLGFFPAEFYRGKKFLILDDTIYTGTEMGRLVAQLTDLGVDRANIRTAAVVSHKLADYRLDCPGTMLNDAEYIVWKEELAQLVRCEVRPTDRDHPLYYFKMENGNLGEFLNALKNFGDLHTVGDDWRSPVFRFSLNVKAECLNKLLHLKGLEVSPLTKIRFYWKETERGVHLTAVPIIFSRVEVEKFVMSESSTTLARLLGVDPQFFRTVFNDQAAEANGAMAYYFVSRSIAALLLRRLIEDLSIFLGNSCCRMQLVEPSVIDKHVDYIFPALYETFYRACSNGLGKAHELEQTKTLPLVDEWPRSMQRYSAPSSGLMPARYQLLELLVEKGEPAEWNGARWSAKKTTVGCEVWDFIERFKDAIFVSTSLDDLFDSGLVRARDARIRGKVGVFGRFIMSGSEYHAVHVSRIADTLRIKVPAIVQEFTEAEPDVLWEPV